MLAEHHPLQQPSHGGVVGHLEQHLLGPGQEPELHHLLAVHSRGVDRRHLLHGVAGAGSLHHHLQM